MYKLNCNKGVKCQDLSTNKIFQIFYWFFFHSDTGTWILSCLSTHVSSENFAKLAALSMIEDQVHLLWK